MSGGYIDPQGDGDHQFVTFTFAGAVTEAQANQWNDEINKLKLLFGPRMLGVTVKGLRTPDKFLTKKRKRSRTR
jgi:hypothetical protein